MIAEVRVAEVRAQQLDLAARSKFVDPGTVIEESRERVNSTYEAMPTDDPQKLSAIYEESASDLAQIMGM